MDGAAGARPERRPACPRPRSVRRLHGSIGWSQHGQGIRFRPQSDEGGVLDRARPPQQGHDPVPTKSRDHLRAKTAQFLGDEGRCPTFAEPRLRHRMQPLDSATALGLLCASPVGDGRVHFVAPKDNPLMQPFLCRWIRNKATGDTPTVCRRIGPCQTPVMASGATNPSSAARYSSDRTQRPSRSICSNKRSRSSAENGSSSSASSTSEMTRPRWRNS